MNLLLAQAQSNFWDAAARCIEANGLWIFVGFCVLAGTAKHVVHRILQHNERMEMIRAGINPDEPNRPKRYQPPAA